MKVIKKEVSAILANIASIKATGVQFYTLAHETAVDCLYLVQQTGDWAPAAELMNALPSGTRRNAMAFWFSEFSSKKLRFTLDKDSGLYRGRLDSDRAVHHFRVDEAADISFADFSKEPAAGTTLTLDKLIAMLGRTATNTKVKKGGVVAVDEKARVAASKALAAILGQTTTA